MPQMSPKKPTKKELEKMLETSEDKAGRYLKDLQYARADMQNMQK